MIDRNAVVYALDFLEKHRDTEYPNEGVTRCSGCGKAMHAATAWKHDPSCPLLPAIEGLKKMLEPDPEKKDGTSANRAIEVVERVRELKESQGAWLLNDEDVSAALKTVLEMAKERGRLRRGLEMLRRDPGFVLNVNVLMLTDAQSAVTRVIGDGLRKMVGFLLDGKEWDGREAYTPPNEK